MEYKQDRFDTPNYTRGWNSFFGQYLYYNAFSLINLKSPSNLIEFVYHLWDYYAPVPKDTSSVLNKNELFVSKSALHTLILSPHIKGLKDPSGIQAKVR